MSTWCGRSCVQNFQHALKKLIDWLVVNVIIFYNVGQMIVFGLPKNRKNDFGYFTHRHLSLLYEIDSIITMRFALKKTEIDLKSIETN